MKIKYLQISNILSFKYYEDVSKAPYILFNDDLSILIGQNGSGKTTVLEVINFIFKRVLFLPYDVNQDLYLNRINLSSNDKKNILRKNANKDYKNFRLEPNWNSENTPQKIRLKIELDEIDEKNLKNLQLNGGKLSELSQICANYAVIDFLTWEKEFIITITLDKDNNQFSVNVSRSISDPGYVYLENYNFYKELIALRNIENLSDPIPPLYESFILIGGYRNYHSFNQAVSLASSPFLNQIQAMKVNERSRSLNANETAEPAIFNWVRLTIAENHYNIFDKKLDKNECEEKANNHSLLLSINKKLRLINLQCRIRLISRLRWEYSFEFYDFNRNKVLTNINSLSAGQKAILHLIFEAYGREELKGGVVVIDEPEIHLHYQFQNEYLRVIEEINKEQSCQYILVTHSESLINSRTIDKVMRFMLDENNDTLVKSPNLLPDQKTLIKILDNTRSTYAFFSKKVVLVEGDTDRYFLKAVLQILHPHLIQEISVIDIGGKKSYKKWKDFFEEFGLEVHYVGDFDNIFECLKEMMKDFSLEDLKGILKQDKLDNLNQKQKLQFKKLYEKLAVCPNFLDNLNREHWKPLIDCFIEFVKVANSEISAKTKELYPKIEQEIDNLYSQKIYIFKQGEIEDYCEIEHDLPQMIKFCEEKLSVWLEENNTKVQEIKLILDKIAGYT